jgi:glycosyltransferase involved in cell wall biosynthesis
VPALQHVELYRLPGRLAIVGRLIGVLKLTTWIFARRRQIAAIHANGFTEFHLVAVAAIIARVQVVVWFHAYRVERWDRRLGRVWRVLVKRRSLVAVSGTARQVVTQTGLAATAEIEIVPNPIDPIDVRASTPPPRSPRQDRVTTVGYLGPPTLDKGFDFLLDVVEKAASIPARWVLFTERRRLDSTTEDRLWRRAEALALQGRLRLLRRERDVRLAYAGCDIVICPSRRESFGRIAAEAMLNSIPVVASDIPPFRALIGDERMLFPVGDADAAGTIIHRLVGDSMLREAVGSSMARRAEAFGPAIAVSRLFDLYGLSETAPRTHIRNG